MIKYLDQLKELVEFNKDGLNWSKMFLASLTITLPLIIGLTRHEIAQSVFGALFSLVFILNDHEGIFRQRLVHLCVTFFFLIMSIFLGAVVSSNTTLLYIIVFSFTILLGKVKSRGIELERLILFCLLYIITIADSDLPTTQIYLPIGYSIISFILYTITVVFLNQFTKHKNILNSKRDALLKSWTNKSVNIFSIYFGFVTVLSYGLLKYINSIRPYWIIGTILIVMSHEKSSVIKKSLQRILGTILGVLSATILLFYLSNTSEIILLISIFSFFFPYAMNKNYWLGNLFIASLIMFFISLSVPNTEVVNLYYVRCIDILIGGLISILSISIFNYFKTFNFLKRRG